MKIKAKYDGRRIEKNKIYQAEITRGHVDYTEKTILILFLNIGGKLLEIHCRDVREFNENWEIINE